MTRGADLLLALRTEPARPSWVRARPGPHRYALAAVCLGAFMGQLDASIVTVAIPTIERGFHQTVGATVWVGLGYLVALVATVAAFGRLSDLVGRKLVYLHGFVVFIAGSALCAIAPNLETLIAFRVLQGLGAAMLQANSVAIIALAVPRERLGRAIGVQGAAQALGLAAGPSLGGLLLSVGGWRLLFLANVPAGLVALVLAWLLVPRSTELHHGPNIDAAGVASLVPALAAALSALTLGCDGLLPVGWAVALGTVAVALAWWFWRHERRSASPLLDPRMLADRGVALGIGGALASYVVLFGVLLAVPFLLERGLGLGVAAAGATLAAMPIAIGVTAPLAGRAIEHVGTRALSMWGMVLCAAGLVVLAASHASALAVAGGLGVLGCGIGLFTPSNNAAVIAAAPRRSAGVASGLLNMGRGLGTALGLALTSSVLAVVAPGAGATTREVTTAFDVVALALVVVTAVAFACAALAGGARSAERVDASARAPNAAG